MRQYHKLLKDVLNFGEVRSDRTGTGTIGLFGAQARFDLKEGFPLVTTKKVHTKSIIHELLWFLKGDTNTKYLNDNGVTIWDEWADENGDLGPIYGEQWINWKCPDGSHINQIDNVIDSLKNDPYSRRHVVVAFNPGVLSEIKTSPPPCHSFFQFHVNQHRQLSCQLYMRSADLFLGVPFNIASYALLTMMIAQVTNLDLGDFVLSIGDAHIYSNHIEQVNKQLSREPRALPRMVINPGIQNIYKFKYDDFLLLDYDPHPGIKAPVAI